MCNHVIWFIMWKLLFEADCSMCLVSVALLNPHVLKVWPRNHLWTERSWLICKSDFQGPQGCSSCSIPCTAWFSVLKYDKHHIAPNLGLFLDDVLSHKKQIVNHCQNHTKRILPLLKKGNGVQWTIWTLWSLISVVKGKANFLHILI